MSFFELFGPFGLLGLFMRQKYEKGHLLNSPFEVVCGRNHLLKCSFGIVREGQKTLNSVFLRVVREL